MNEFENAQEAKGKSSYTIEAERKRIHGILKSVATLVRRKVITKEEGNTILKRADLL